MKNDLQEKIQQHVEDVTDAVERKQAKWMMAHICKVYPNISFGISTRWEIEDVVAKFIQEHYIEQGWHTIWLYHKESVDVKKKLGVFKWMFSEDHEHTLIMKWSFPGDIE